MAQKIVKQPAYFTLSNGIKMPSMGLGTWLSKTNEVGQAVEIAVKHGYRLIDTAYVYGNEKEIGDALAKIFKEGKIKREEIFITTKLHAQHMHKEDVLPILKHQLSLLQVDYVDLYLIHSPCAVQKVEGVKFPVENALVLGDPVDYLETWQAMEEVYKQGLTKSIGLSNFSMKQIQRVYDNATVKPHNLQLACHAYWPQNELFDLCKKLKIVMTAYGPVGRPGDRSGSALPAHQTVQIKRPILLEDDVVKGVASKWKCTPAQVLLCWLLQRGIAVIPKSVNGERIKENFDAIYFHLDEDDMKKLSNLPIRERLFTAREMFREHPYFAGDDYF